MPEALVSSTTEKAPSCKVIMQPSTLDRMILVRMPSLPKSLPVIMGRHSR